MGTTHRRTCCEFVFRRKPLTLPVVEAERSSGASAVQKQSNGAFAARSTERVASAGCSASSEDFLVEEVVNPKKSTVELQQELDASVMCGKNDECIVAKQGAAADDAFLDGDAPTQLLEASSPLNIFLSRPPEDYDLDRTQLLPPLTLGKTPGSLNDETFEVDERPTQLLPPPPATEQLRTPLAERAKGTDTIYPVPSIDNIHQMATQISELTPASPQEGELHAKDGPDFDAPTQVLPDDDIVEKPAQAALERMYPVRESVYQNKSMTIDLTSDSQRSHGSSVNAKVLGSASRVGIHRPFVGADMTLVDEYSTVLIPGSTPPIVAAAVEGTKLASNPSATKVIVHCTFPNECMHVPNMVSQVEDDTIILVPSRDSCQLSVDCPKLGLLSGELPPTGTVIECSVVEDEQDATRRVPPPTAEPLPADAGISRAPRSQADGDTSFVNGCGLSILEISPVIGRSSHAITEHNSLNVFDIGRARRKSNPSQSKSQCAPPFETPTGRRVRRKSLTTPLASDWPPFSCRAKSDSQIEQELSGKVNDTQPCLVLKLTANTPAKMYRNPMVHSHSDALGMSSSSSGSEMSVPMPFIAPVVNRAFTTSTQDSQPNPIPSRVTQSRPPTRIKAGRKMDEGNRRTKHGIEKLLGDNKDGQRLEWCQGDSLADIAAIHDVSQSLLSRNRNSRPRNEGGNIPIFSRSMIAEGQSARLTTSDAGDLVPMEPSIAGDSANTEATEDATLITETTEVMSATISMLDASEVVSEVVSEAMSLPDSSGAASSLERIVSESSPSPGISLEKVRGQKRRASVLAPGPQVENREEDSRKRPRTDNEALKGLASDSEQAESDDADADILRDSKARSNTEGVAETIRCRRRIASLSEVSSSSESDDSQDPDYQQTQAVPETPKPRRPSRVYRRGGQPSALASPLRSVSSKSPQKDSDQSPTMSIDVCSSRSTKSDGASKQPTSLSPPELAGQAARVPKEENKTNAMAGAAMEPARVCAKPSRTRKRASRSTSPPDCTVSGLRNSSRSRKATTQQVQATRLRTMSVSAIPSEYKVDEIVWAKWPDDKYYYPARVRAKPTMEATAYRVRYLDGDSIMREPQQLRPYSVCRGQHVYAYINADEMYAATVLELADNVDDEYHVQFSRDRLRKFVQFDCVLMSEEQMRTIDCRRPSAEGPEDQPDASAAKSEPSLLSRRKRSAIKNEEATGKSKYSKSPSFNDGQGTKSKKARRSADKPKTSRNGGFSVLVSPPKRGVRRTTSISTPTAEHENISISSCGARPRRRTNSCSSNSSRSITRTATTRSSDQLFTGLSFLVTVIKCDEPQDADEEDLSDLAMASAYVTNPLFNRQHVAELIEKNGGHVLDSLDSLTQEKVEAQPRRYFCIASAPKRSMKYLMALALGVPRVSCQWILDCVAAENCLDYAFYQLPNGMSMETRCHLSALRCSNAFRGKALEIIGKPKFQNDWAKPFVAAGAVVVKTKNKGTRGPIEKAEAGTSCYVLVQHSKCPPKVKANTFYVTTEWAIQCLINQRWLDPSRNPAYHV